MALYHPENSLDIFRGVMKKHVLGIVNQFRIGASSLSVDTCEHVRNAVLTRINSMDSISDLQKIYDSVSEMSLVYMGSTIIGWHSPRAFANNDSGGTKIYAQLAHDLELALLNRIQELKIAELNSMTGKEIDELIKFKFIQMSNEFFKAFWMDTNNVEQTRRVFNNWNVLSSTDFRKLVAFKELDIDEHEEIDEITRRMQMKFFEQLRVYLSRGVFNEYLASLDSPNEITPAIVKDIIVQNC